MEFDPNDPSTWDERSKDNYDEEGNLKEVLMLSPTSYPEERFTKEGKSYYYTRRNEEGVVEPITSGGLGDTLKALTPLVNMVNPVMGLTNHLFKDKITEKRDSTDWSLKDLAYPLNVPFGGKRQGNLGDWTFATWAVNQAPSQLAAARTGLKAAKGKYFYRSPVKQPINITPKDESGIVKGSSNIGALPKRTDSQIVRQHGQKAGFAGPEGEPLVRLNFTPSSVFQMDANASLLKDAVKKDFYPELKPHRSYTTTSELKTLDEYKDAWRNWGDKSLEGRNAFYNEYGQWITPENFKMKPDLIRQTPADKEAGIKRFSNEMNIRSDKNTWTRKQRGDILTYMSGEVPISTKKAGYTDPVTGHNIIPHHRTSHGELAPWTDIIIEKLNSPDPKIKAEGKQMLEIGKAVFAKHNIKVGDTLKNYEGYFHEAHLGPGSIHDKLTEHRITGPSSRSAFDFTKGENALSKGIKVGDKVIPTKEYLQQLPWKPGGNTGEFGENTFWTSLVDYIQTSNAAREFARQEVLQKFGPQGKDWAKGER